MLTKRMLQYNKWKATKDTSNRRSSILKQMFREQEKSKLYWPDTRKLRSEWHSLPLTGTIKYSVLGDAEDVQRVKHVLKLFNGTIVGVYKRKEKNGD